MEEKAKRPVGRPKGSLNKTTLAAMQTRKSSGGVYVTQLERHIENTPLTRNSAMGWRKWGDRNNYCDLLLDLYAQSPTHHAACDFGVASICGNGVDFEQMKLNGDEVVPNGNQTWDDVIKGLATDYILFGSYALECIMNKDGKTFSFYHIPLHKVRWSEYDENGEIPSYWVASDWTEIGKNPPIEIQALNFSKDMRLEKGVPYLYVYHTYSPTMDYYTNPHYSAGISAIQSEVEFVRHDLKSATNNFVPSGMLVLNEMENDEERNAVVKNIQNMFVGTQNSNSIMITFRSNVEEQAPSFVPFTANQGNVNLYADANERTINRILCSHQIPNAALIGLPDLVGSGFSSEAAKLEVSYQLYNKLTGNANRMAVIRTLNQMLALNGIDTSIIMKPLNFADFGDDANVQERTNATPINEDDKEDQTEEKVENE